ncbi:MAG TPA: DUF1638 domain-containing protein [Candidatus Hydrogenedentes bacterium]|nr:DUF1638 domain-containing protein [Candidatus Hydrogenedentota bacterium]HOJ68617.1 DUF1638 domain-containing protein [Candidatus Hydrogenedentota bacterium]HOK88969.1 DUF1638 domain-containing protein [Candidatus Hydrogenedentota bacterium]
MRIRLLACAALTREICWCVARSAHTVDLVFMDKGAHVNPDRLRGRLQQLIDETDAAAYDRVILAYGLCGRVVDGLRAGQLPVTIPRAHDCATLLTGSRQAFLRYFGDQLSRPWTAVGYGERDGGTSREAGTNLWTNGEPDPDELIRQYGEEGARVILDAMRAHDAGDGELWFLDVPETRQPVVEQALASAAARKGLRLKKIPGDLSLLRRLTDGPWDDADFLTLRPGQRVEAVFDHDQVIRAVDE